jgi:hypothetical protein
VVGRALAWWGVIAVSAAVTLWEAPTQLRHLRSDIEVGSRSRLTRELQPATSAGLVELHPFLVADAVVPADARIYVMAGPRAGVTDQRVLDLVRPFARYWLFPRRITRDPAKADWVLSYGAGLERPGLSFRRVITVDPGVLLAAVSRPR